MVQQLTGTATVLVVVLAYVLLAQALMAAIVLMGQFIVVQACTLSTLVAAEWRRHESAPMNGGQGQPYRVGGGIKRWE